VVGVQLEKNNFTYARIDGTMSASQRDAAMELLEKDDNTTVLLASLGVCSVGLNLVAANQVILADSWWAPAIEDQAVDRVHRLGQTKPTTVFRLVMADSIEDRVLEIQQRKRKLMMMAFAEKKAKRGNEKGAQLKDIETLLSRGSSSSSS
jgi:SWI/SNF-related matrix-associated actin-dependent regulator of chromatin subfamily A3